MYADRTLRGTVVEVKGPQAQLEKLVAQLDEAGVRHVLVGGPPNRKATFKTPLGLLEALAELGHPFTEVGIVGYPEGHPLPPAGPAHPTGDGCGEGEGQCHTVETLLVGHAESCEQT